MSKVLWIIIGIVALCLIALAIGLVLYYAFRSDEAVPPGNQPPPPGNQPPPPGDQPPPPDNQPPPPPDNQPPPPPDNQPPPPPDNQPPPPPPPPPAGTLAGTSTGSSTNRYLSVQCPTVQMDPTKLNDCTDLVYNNAAGTVSGNCRASSSSPMASTSINMAQCNTCNITSRNGKLVCDIDYSGCPDTIYVQGLDISGNDIASYDGTVDCVDHCDERGCYWATYNAQGKCVLKQSPVANNFSSGFALHNNSTTCPSYYVIPNTNVTNHSGITYNGLTLNQCEQKCTDANCDWYEYYGPSGQCTLKTGDRYGSTSAIKTMYPIVSMK